MASNSDKDRPGATGPGKQGPQDDAPGKDKTDANPSAAERKQASRPPRQPVTIDLKATESSDKDKDPGKPAAGTDAKPGEKPTSAAGGAKTADTGKTEDPKAAAKPDPKAPPKPDEKPKSAAAGAAPKADPGATKMAPPPVQSSGAGSRFVAALLGGVIALGGAYGLIQTGKLQLPGAQEAAATQTALSEAEAKIAALEERIAGGGELATTVDGLSTRVSALEAAPDDTGTSDQVAALAERLTAAEAAAQSAAEAVPDLTPLNEEVAELRRLVSTGAAGSDVALESLQSEITDLKSGLQSTQDQVATLADKPAGDPSLPEKVADIDSRLAATESTASDTAEQLKQVALTAQQADVASGAGVALGPDVKALQAATQTLTENVDAATSQLSALQSGQEALTTKVGSLEETVTSLDQRMGSAEEQLGGVTARETAARALAVASLSDAVDAGRPYSTELSAVAASLGDGVDLSALEAHAESGLPTRAELVQRFDAVADAMLATTSEVPEDAGILDKFLVNARSSVQVRPSGDSGGTSVASIVARMEAQVKAGKLAEALGEMDALPDDAKAAGADWAAAVQARLQAESLVRQTAKDVLTMLSGNAPAASN
ncbi:mitofilin family membrane protein [Rhodobium gokarnense]|uniref:Mitochondrial inner membrane protein n=1 Tax=Rhodobium gokarnense TaxID=364296 RepID=A0ABT3HHH5_9HYPH|nr:mitofilin family membrane protein [Rhodobium gokarnense]MCW2309858.1 hypothetical protein [Rhodobium gokarnense]